MDHSSLTLGTPPDHLAPFPSLPSLTYALQSIDHLYAVDFIDRVHKDGGKILSFKSFCGGLAAPESKTNTRMRLKLPKLIKLPQTPITL
jgi:hypothetical protein